MKCGQCGRELVKDAKFCAGCGTPVPQQPEPQQPEEPAVVNRFCPGCGTKLSSPNAQFCGACGRKLETPSSASGGRDLLGTLWDKLDEITGNEKQKDLKLKDLFSEVFRKHTKEEAEEIFISGTAKTTPAEGHLLENWKKPWLYSRVFLVFAVSYLLLYFCAAQFENANALPGMIIMGSFMVPFSLLFMMFELNAPKNISFYSILQVFLIGGCASLLVTLVFFSIWEVDELDVGGAIAVGIIEEVGKFAIVAWCIYYKKNTKFILNGILIGAAVGAGFAAFESAGYAYVYGSNGFDVMVDVILKRAILAPGGHVAWAAMEGAALMLAKGDEPLRPEHFKKRAFWQIALFPIVLHAFWDMPFAGAVGTLLPYVLTVLGWVILLALIQSGLGQVNRVEKGGPLLKNHS